MHIKRIDQHEYSLVSGLFNQYRVFYEQASDLQLAEAFIRERLKNRESVIFVAFVEEDGKIKPAGFTQLYPNISSVRAVRNWTLNDLYVDAPYRRSGIARQLIETAIQFAREQGGKILQLETAPDNTGAQQLYETIGFERQSPATEFYLYSFTL